MSNEVAENLREIASNLLAAANRLDGIDVSADAMRGGTVCVDSGGGTSTYRHATGAIRRLRACVENWPDCAEGEYNPRCCRWPKSCSATVYDDDQVTDADLEPERGGTMRVMTGRGFGVHVHRDPINPLQIGDCPWPDRPCVGHRTGLGGVPLLTVSDDQAVHVPHVHAPTSALPGVACSEIICHATHGRQCRYCGGAPCRITPLERGA